MREGRLVRAHISCYTVMSFMRAMLCLLAAAAPVGVRFVEGALHGFIVLRTVNGVLIATPLIRARSL
jgi:hypothetical protein